MHFLLNIMIKINLKTLNIKLNAKILFSAFNSSYHFFKKIYSLYLILLKKSIISYSRLNNAIYKFIIIFYYSNNFIQQFNNNYHYIILFFYFKFNY